MAAALVSTILALASPAHAADETLGKWWFDFGLGYGDLSTNSPISHGGSGLWVDAQVGGRINSHWLAGIDIGGIGLHANENNCGHSDDYYDYYCSVYDETVTNIFLVVQYEPKSDHGWFFGAGAGGVIYDNKQLDDISGSSHSGEGFGGLVRVGYDWQFRPRNHIEALLSFETADTTVQAPFSGKFNFSVIAASVHYAFH